MRDSVSALCHHGRMATDSQETKRTVRTFAWASFLHDMGADMVFSVWPLFLRNVLGASMTAVGVIDGLGDAVVSLSQAASGYASDRLRRRKVFVWVGYLFGGIARLGYVVAQSWPVAIPFRILDRSGKLRGAPRDAIIADVSNDENRGKHFGYQRAMDNLGAVFGVVIALLLVETIGFRMLFLIAAVPSFIAVLLIVFRIRERRPDGDGLFRGIRLKDLSPNLRLFIVLNGLFNLGAFSYSFLLLAASDKGIATGAVPVLYLLFNIVAAAVSAPAGRLVDVWGGKPVFALSLLGWAAVVLLLPFTQSPAVVAIAFACYGLHKGFYDPVQRAMLAALAPREFSGSVFGGFQLVMGVVSLPASLLAGWLWDLSGSPVLPFLLSLGLTAVSGVLLVFLRERRA